MKLYFSPLACSLASRIVVHETSADVTFVEVDPKTKRTLDGDDYSAIHPLGLVPALRLDDGQLLTENAAILQHLAERHPAAHLAPTGPGESIRMRELLSFVATELHKSIYQPLLDRKAPPAVKEYAMAKVPARLSFVATKLDGREFLFDSFSVADAFLFTVLNWSVATPIDLSRWPSLASYVARLRKRPSVARALGEELPLFRNELARHGDTMPGVT